MDKDALRFIDKLYKDLYKSEEVLHHSSGKETDKFNNIEEYLNTLERVHDRATQTERRTDTLKRLYMEKYVIKKEDIPDSYYQNQQRIALERGFGHIQISNEQKQELANEVINNQKKSLENWLDYFFSEDSKFYPFWAKYWAFQGMLRLGSYDKSKGIFNKRTKETVAPFADLNQEALSMSMDYLIKYIGKEKIEDQELEQVITGGSFQKMYPYILKNVLSNNENIIKRNEGKWVKYNQGSDHMPLVRSLQGYNTGWCTAGESTAKAQLECGDFYVYYTLDEKGEYKVPRIAIRMEHGEIGEIRGIAKNQNLESEMEKVVAEKIKDFPDKDKYYKKVNDMKQMTDIYNKWKNNEELSIEELRFLYEINYEIEGFGYRKDPRIKEILVTRDNVKDLNLILRDVDAIVGNLDLSHLTSAEGLDLSNKNIGGNLYFNNLTDSKGLKLPKNILGDALFSGLINAEDLDFSNTEFIGTLYLNGLTSAEGLDLSKTNIEGLYLNSLTNAKGLKLPKTIKGHAHFSGLTSAEDLDFSNTEFIGALYLNGLTSAKGLDLSNTDIKWLYLDSLTNAEGLILPKTKSIYISLKSLTSAKGLKLPELIGGLDLNSLTSAEGLTLPQNIGNLYLRSLINAKGLLLPKYIYGDLALNSLTSLEGLDFSNTEYIAGILYLNSLTNAKGLDLSNTNIGERVFAPYLTNLDGVILPDKLTYCIHCNRFMVTPKNVDEYRNDPNSFYEKYHVNFKDIGKSR